ncbi:MAG: hypothetical protein H7844_08415 [Nitrospirae bacterium YQR-1]
MSGLEIVILYPLLMNPAVLAAAGGAVIGKAIGTALYNAYKDSKATKEKDAYINKFDKNLDAMTKNIMELSKTLNNNFQQAINTELTGFDSLRANIKSAGSSIDMEHLIIQAGDVYKKIRKNIEIYRLQQIEAQWKDTDIPELTGETEKTLFSQKEMKEDVITLKKPVEKELFVSEIHKYHALIKTYDMKIYTELAPICDAVKGESLTQRVKAVRDEVLLKYGKLKEEIAWTNVYKETIGELINEALKYPANENTVSDASKLLNSKYISKDNYDSVSKILSEFIIKAENKKSKLAIAAKIGQTLRNLGYMVDENDETTVSKLDSGEIVYFDTEQTDYKVMAKLSSEGELTTRLVRFVSSEDETKSITTLEKQRDSEAAKKWCANFDKFLEKLKDDNIYSNVILRKEPEELEIMYVVNKDMATSKKSVNADAEIVSSSRRNSF